MPARNQKISILDIRKQITVMIRTEISLLILFLTCASCNGAGNRTIENDAPAMYKDELMPGEHAWFVSPSYATKSLSKDTILLDARSYALYAISHISGSMHISWKDYSREHSGLLREPDVLKHKLTENGITESSWILVYGGAKDGWGEEGRIAWMLRSLGYRALIVDGGFESLADYLETSYGPARGNLKVRESSQVAVLGLESENVRKEQRSDLERLSIRKQSASELTIGMQELNEIRKSARIILLDSRERREFLGETPYGENRGGHIPGALHLYYQDLIQDNGRIVSKESLLKILVSRKAVREALLKPGTVRSPSEVKGSREGSDSETFLETHTNDSIEDHEMEAASRQELEKIKEIQFITYCTGGVRSAFVTAVLQHYGFKARNYPGSMWEWSAQPDADYPLESGTDNP
ncbi:MAG TPA: hypothetical protein DEA96_07775 [Leptospiraceae bacterium]|nr:hypothetical protein [Spirochaetaceae bacterium]HBS04845.1 hypothetical protein [Leptospiraceae bacterium]